MLTLPLLADAPALGLVLAAFGAALVLLRRAQRRLRLHPEVARKALHVAMGTAALSFPFLFDRLAPVAVLGVATTAALLVLRRGRMCRGVARVVHGVARRSYGDLCFPAAILATFWLSGGTGPAFVLPIAVLAFADPAAALVGLDGRRRYRCADVWKTWRGSAAFFGIALVLGLVVLRDAAAALAVAAAATVLEAIAWRGLDNLLIPLGAWLALALAGTVETGPLALAVAGAALAVAGLLPLVAARDARRRTRLRRHHARRRTARAPLVRAHPYATKHTNTRLP